MAAVRAARERRLADALFVVQVVCATAFGVAQLGVMRTTVEGVSTTWFLFWLFFLIVNLVLAHRDGSFHTFHVDVEVHDLAHLHGLVAALRAADGVSQVERI